jgi:hypothetical protein
VNVRHASQTRRSIVLYANIPWNWLGLGAALAPRDRRPPHSSVCIGCATSQSSPITSFARGRN